MRSGPASRTLPNGLWRRGRARREEVDLRENQSFLVAKDISTGSTVEDSPCGVDRELTVRAEPRAALYSSLRLLHFAAIILWVGGGFSLPVVADIRRTVALGRAHGSALHARLVTATRLVAPAAVVALLTGVALIQLRGGFGAVPSLMTDFDS